jgi:hypothetical protein
VLGHPRCFLPDIAIELWVVVLILLKGSLVPPAKVDRELAFDPVKVVLEQLIADSEKLDLLV